MLLDSVDSTNAWAPRLGADSPPTWIMAAEQTGGKGRRGRPWHSPRGNLYATLSLHPKEPPETVALRSFVAALALRDACVALTGLEACFTLKWPNDVLLNGGKLAGILLESSGQAGGISHLAIGIGVNLVAAPLPGQVEQGATNPVSLLAETGLRISPPEFLTALARAYATREAVFVTQGFAPLRDDWLAHAARRFETLTARTGNQSQTGRFETIDASGALILATATGQVTIPAADIYF